MSKDNFENNKEEMKEEQINLDENTAEETIVEGAEQEGGEAMDNDASNEENPDQDSTEGQETIEKIKKDNQELKDKYLRLYAEFENYKKRTVKEKVDLMKSASQDTMAALLPVLDDFDRAKKNAEDENSEEVFSKGISLVYQKLYSILKMKGLEEMESTGESFDPEFHEAVTEIPAPSEDLKGKVIDTIEKGYTLGEKIIRHAKVVVGK